MAGEERVHDVMLAEPGGKSVNTVVVGGTDVIVPLERDADGDPFHDDEVWLRSASGAVDLRLLSSDPDVEASPRARRWSRTCWARSSCWG
jgi:hypothetical protein